MTSIFLSYARADDEPFVRQLCDDLTAAVAESLIAPGNFDQAYGPLAGDTILAFTAKGEAHWFRLRRRDGA